MKETQEEKLKVYNILISINEVKYDKRTTDVKKTIMELKPEFVFTDTYITLSKGTGENKIVTERKLSLMQGKKIFNNEDVLNAFVANLLVEFT